MNSWTRRVAGVAAVVGGGCLMVALPAAASTSPEGVSAAEAGAYFDDVAVELAQPGVWVDPDVDELSSADIADLEADIAEAPVPMRIAVVPADKITTSSGYYVDLAWPDAEIPSELYDRVGVDGVYAVLVDASSSEAGRGFHGVHHDNDGPTYHVEDAIDRAVECCAPNYDDMIEQFVQRASDVDQPAYIDAAPWAGTAAVLGGGWWGVSHVSARRRRRRDEENHVIDLRPVLNEEIIDLSARVAAEGNADVGTSGSTTAVLDLVEKARQRLDAASTDSDIVAVNMLLDDARYQLACLEATRDGKPAPPRTVPCFFDPRHGPSIENWQWAPRDGIEREVPACTACVERLAAEQVPDIRMIGGDPYWDAGESSVPYVEGYWRDSIGRFPDSDLRVRRNRMIDRWAQDRPRQRFGRGMGSLGRGVASVLTSSGSDDDSWGSGGGSGRSRSTRSFGGGSSSRSSSRSSGSRRF